MPQKRKTSVNKAPNTRNTRATPNTRVTSNTRDTRRKNNKEKEPFGKIF
jgi:hypothetical protein